MTYTIPQCRAALKSRKGQWPKIATAAGVSYSWLCKFAAGRVTNPTTGSIEKLSAALKVVK